MNQHDTAAQAETPDMARTRRGFLRDLTLGSLAAAGAVAAVTAATPAAAAEPATTTTTAHPGTVKVFRFRTRETVSCRACKLHHRYMVFRTRKVARKHRAHPGCDCPIEPQWVERKTYRMLFKANGVTTNVANLKPTRRR